MANGIHESRVSDIWLMDEGLAAKAGRRAGRGLVSSASPAMSSVQSLLSDVAPTDIPVIFMGESGTGKDTLARQLHELSPRRGGIFQKVSCSGLNSTDLAAALSISMVESGPRAKDLGGTLFLDDVVELDSACQSKLLSALPDGPAFAAAPGRPATAARIVCSTSQSLEQCVRTGRFREDLYFRINGVCLRIPALRHRREDIPLLLDFFLGKFAAELGRPKPPVSTPALDLVLGHSWPGNIRELENFARKLVLFEDAQAVLADLQSDFGLLPEERTNGKRTISLKEVSRAASRQAERELILKTLRRTRWNRKRAARELQISYKALLYKLKQIGCEDLGAT